MLSFASCDETENEPPQDTGESSRPEATTSNADARKPTGIWVGPLEGDFRSVQQALDSIADASADNRYVIRVRAGIYDGFVMKPFVDIAGASKWLTTITQGTSQEKQTVRGHNHAELRNLTVKAVTKQELNVAIRVPARNKIQLRNVNIRIAGPGHCFGIKGDGEKTKAMLRGVEITGKCPRATGVRMRIGDVDLKNVDIRVKADRATGIVAGTGKLETVTIVPNAGTSDTCGSARGVIANAQSWRLHNVNIRLRGCSNFGVDFRQEKQNDAVANLRSVMIGIKAQGFENSLAIGRHLGIRSFGNTKISDVTVRGGPPRDRKAAIVLKGGSTYTNPCEHSRPSQRVGNTCNTRGIRSQLTADRGQTD